MRKTLLIAAIFLAANGARASELDHVAAAIAGTEASFTQRFTPKGFRNSEVESGTVIFGELPKMRWTYTKPEEKVFVFDGARSWFYVPADKQVTESTVDDEKKSELPFLLIGDPAARGRLFDVTESSRGGRIVVRLEPRAAAAAVRNIVLTIVPATHAIEQLSYSDREGNHTLFEFSGYHPRDVSSGTFEFRPPPGTDVISNP